MPYKITATSPEGQVSFRSKTAAETLQTAADLIDLGLEEVSITDAEGRRYTPTEFSKKAEKRSLK
jgi:hypothetical protein